jgi:hypothetical protein
MFAWQAGQEVYRVMQILFMATLKLPNPRLIILEFFGQELDKFSNRLESKDKFWQFLKSSTLITLITQH